MGGFTVECDGEFIEMPFDGNWMVSTLEGRFPNSDMLRMDGNRFKLGFEKHCVSTGDARAAMPRWPIAGTT